MLDLSLLRRPSFVGPALISLISSATLVASTSYVALYFINTMGYTPFQSGIRFLPLTVASFLAAPPAAKFGHLVPTRYSMPATGALVAIGLASMTGLDADSSWTHLFIGFVIAGAGLGMSSALISQAALAAVPMSQAGMATGTANTFRQIGLAAGVAALGSIFTTRVTHVMSSNVTALHLPAGGRDELATAVGSGAGVQVATHVNPAIATQVAEAARAATASGVNAIFEVGAWAAAFVTIAAFVAMRKGANGRAAGRNSPSPDRRAGHHPARIEQHTDTPHQASPRRLTQLAHEDKTMRQ